MSTPIRTARGGRQGCRLGAIVFNFIYAKALREARNELRDANVILQLPRREADAFWVTKEEADEQRRERGEDHAEEVMQEVVETTYVDDELMMLSATEPTALEKAIKVMMTALDGAMARHGFLVNWKRGKTEIMMKLRGSKAAVVEQRLVNELDGEPVIVLPSGRQVLQVVKHYRHLGGIITDDGGMNAEVIARCTAAMTAYVPLACRIFGCRAISVPLRMSFCSSLVMSRLLYNAATWPELSGPNVKRLNRAYMTVLRKIAGRPRAGGAAATSDESIRQLLGAPSIDCLLIKARLRALPQILRSGPPCLLSLLQVRGERTGRQIPWARTLAGDMVTLQHAAPDKLRALGDPSKDARDWRDLARGFPVEWKQLVGRIHFSTATKSHSHGEQAATTTKSHDQLVADVAEGVDKSLQSACGGEEISENAGGKRRVMEPSAAGGEEISDNAGSSKRRVMTLVAAPGDAVPAASEISESLPEPNFIFLPHAL